MVGVMVAVVAGFYCFLIQRYEIETFEAYRRQVKKRQHIDVMEAIPFPVAPVLRRSAGNAVPEPQAAAHLGLSDQCCIHLGLSVQCCIQCCLLAGPCHTPHLIYLDERHLEPDCLYNKW